MLNNNLYLWIPFVVNDRFTDFAPERAEETAVRSSDDRTYFSCYDTHAPICEGVQMTRETDKGILYNLETSKFTNLGDPSLNHTFCIWYKYSPNYITEMKGTHYLISFGNFSISLTFDTSTSKIKLDNTWVLEPDTWYHIALERHQSYTSSTLYGYSTWYLNGEKIGGPYRTTGGYGTLNSICLFGKGISISTTTTPLYTFSVADFKLYNKSLTQEEIYNLIHPKLLAHYTLDHLPSLEDYLVSNCADNPRNAAVQNLHLESLNFFSDDYDYEDGLPILVSNNPFQKGKYRKSFQFKDKATSTHIGLYSYSLLSEIGGPYPRTFTCWFTTSSEGGCLFAFNTRGGVIVVGVNDNGDLMMSEYGHTNNDYVDYEEIIIGDRDLYTEFSHLALVYTTSEYLIYINGELIASHTCIGDISFPSEAFCIGFPKYVTYANGADITATNEDGIWGGKVSDFRIYNGALSREEIVALINKTVYATLSENEWYAYEFIESEDSLAQMQPTLGVLSSKKLNEQSSTTVKIDNNGIGCSTFYEI